MGMDLSGKGGYFGFNNQYWAKVISLAVEFSWQPMGTQPGWNSIRRYRYDLRKRGKTVPQIARAIALYRKKWHGLYWPNDGQAVTARDAKNMADALSVAFGAIEDLFTVHKKRTSMRADFSTELMESLKSFADDENRKTLRKFIAFCRAGRFEIN
jgi:hypothetical protein